MKVKNNENVSSIEKAFEILEVLARPPYEYNVSEIAKVSGINRTTVYRILSLLKGKDAVILDEDSDKYKLGPLNYSLGSIYMANANYENNLLKLLKELAELSKESVGLARRDGDKVISLYEVESYQPAKMHYKPGTFYPMNKGCYGKCLMAYYDPERVKTLLYKQTYEKTCSNTLTDPQEILEEYERIRKQGYVQSISETQEYAIGIGAPVFDSKGQTRICIAISFIKADDFEEKMERLGQLILNYSLKISKFLP